jgi:hypothetical protein
MDNGVILIILLAFLGPALVYATRYVVKGRTPTAMRLWFVSVFSYVVYYMLASGSIIDAKIAPYYFALLWPIPAILTFWFVEKALSTTKQTPIHMFKWVAFFLSGVVFAFILDIIADAVGWYTYNTSGITTGLLENPFTGIQTPAMVLMMLGVLMLGTFYLCDSFFRWLRQKVTSNASATYLLVGVAFIMGGLIWVIGDIFLQTY